MTEYSYPGAEGVVTIPSTLGGVPVTSIGQGAFQEHTNFTSIIIPQGVTSIGDYAFGWCTGLTSISMPQAVTSIGMQAFASCTGLTSMKFNSSTTIIPDAPDTIPTQTKIIGYAPSTAKDYAAKYNRTFEVIGVTPTIEVLTVSNPTTTGFTVALSPSLDALTASNFTLLNSSNNHVTITGVTTSDNGATYTISAALSAGQTYTVTAANTGYDFGSPVNLTVTNQSPVVTSLSPRYGRVSGGTTVIITGTGFTGATAVQFHYITGAASTTTNASFTIDSDTQITATTPAAPPGASGQFPVTVTTPNGSSPIEQTGDVFTYTVKPVITLNGLSDVTVQVGGAYTDAGATAINSSDVDITSSIIATGTVDTTKAGDYTIHYNVTDSSGDVADEVIRTVHVVTVLAQFSAKPIIQIGANPNDNNSLGIFIGLDNIAGQTGNTIANPNPDVAGYNIEVDYDPAKVNVLDVVDEVHMGQFTKNVNAVAGKVLVADAATNGITNYSKLFFIPINLIGSALDSTSLQVKYLNVRDTNLDQIDVENPVALVFQRGKIYNEGLGIQPNISDVVAGLQYLAGLRNAGVDLGQVNLINMASIVGQEAESTVIKPSVKDIIALMQYLVQLRDVNFNTVNNQ
ncbi:MAG: immunoglobulin-like domain-containing protein [Desulfosporosinus sp.]